MADALRNIMNENTRQLDVVKVEVQSRVGAYSQSLTDVWNAHDFVWEKT